MTPLGRSRLRVTIAFTPEIAASQLAEFEPLDEVPPERHLALRTDRPLDAVLDELEAALDARLEAPIVAGEP